MCGEIPLPWLTQSLSCDMISVLICMRDSESEENFHTTSLSEDPAGKSPARPGSAATISWTLGILLASIKYRPGQW